MYTVTGCEMGTGTEFKMSMLLGNEMNALRSDANVTFLELRKVPKLKKNANDPIS